MESIKVEPIVDRPHSGPTPTTFPQGLRRLRSGGTRGRLTVMTAPGACPASVWRMLLAAVDESL